MVGVHDIRRTLDFYATTFGLPVTEPAPSRVEVLADAWGLPRSQPFLLGIARLKPRDIMGYCIAAMFAAFIIMALGLLIFD